MYVLLLLFESLKRLTNMCIGKKKEEVKQFDRDFFFLVSLSLYVPLHSQITGVGIIETDDDEEEEKWLYFFFVPTGYEN